MERVSCCFVDDLCHFGEIGGNGKRLDLCIFLSFEWSFGECLASCEWSVLQLVMFLENRFWCCMSHRS